MPSYPTPLSCWTSGLALAVELLALLALLEPLELLPQAASHSEQPTATQLARLRIFIAHNGTCRCLRAR
ncbi:MAG: hypothetical protein JO206_06390 [Solirubrobacterales bacterium]|nr:hypothetical protein [Solirubrobacterales bacterium]MBV9472579.1 hypothetical protein [Solirubrobacterales bacterium]